MENNIYTFLDKILKSNFSNCTYKYTYLYNEIFISINDINGFILFGINHKGEKIIINKYCGKENRNGIILLVLIKKYEKVFFNGLNEFKKTLFKIGDETDFINIYDKKELLFSDIKKILKFSFLDDYTYRRRSEMDFNFENKSELSIYHSDFECSKCDGPKESFTNFIDFRNGIFDSKYFENKHLNKKYTHLVTNISDYESITIGGNEKINDILSNKELVNDYDYVSINKTCISVIMGDDITSVLNYNKIPSEKVIYTDQNIDSGYRAIINFLKNINIKDVNEQIDEIVFFGLNKNKNTFELIDFLKQNFGIKVGNVLLPNIDKQDLEEILKYKFSVFFNGKEIKSQNIFKLYPLDNFETKVPYSLTNNFDLYNNILVKSNKSSDVLKLNDIFDDLKLNNITLFKKSSKYSIGFILFDYHIKYFLNDNFRGVDMLAALQDMGFNLNFFINSDSDKYFDYKQELSLKYSSILFSNKILELDNFIEDKNIDLYYSEINNDKRIIGKNKQLFSVGDFEYGVDGFYRTFNKLLKKCEKVGYFRQITK